MIRTKLSCMSLSLTALIACENGDFSAEKLKRLGSVDDSSEVSTCSILPEYWEELRESFPVGMRLEQEVTVRDGDRSAKASYTRQILSQSDEAIEYQDELRVDGAVESLNFVQNRSNSGRNGCSSPSYTINRLPWEDINYPSDKLETVKRLTDKVIYLYLESDYDKFERTRKTETRLVLGKERRVSVTKAEGTDKNGVGMQSERVTVLDLPDFMSVAEHDFKRFAAEDGKPIFEYRLEMLELKFPSK